jgi:hypothetical protein
MDGGPVCPVVWVIVLPMVLEGGAGRRDKDQQPTLDSIPDTTHTQLSCPHHAWCKRDGARGGRGGLVPAPLQGPGGQRTCLRK